MSKFTITNRKNGEFQFTLSATNGQVILTSQGYSSRANCTNGIESVRKNAMDESKFVEKTAADGSPYFVLMATNGQVIGTSQMYASAEACKKGIASVQANAANAVVADETQA
jgi:uncharacterized protein YegP (UPF0339 family)